MGGAADTVLARPDDCSGGCDPREPSREHNHHDQHDRHDQYPGVGETWARSSPGRTWSLPDPSFVPGAVRTVLGAGPGGQWRRSEPSLAGNGPGELDLIRHSAPGSVPRPGHNQHQVPKRDHRTHNPVGVLETERDSHREHLTTSHKDEQNERSLTGIPVHPAC